MLLALATITLTQIWACRVDSEFTDFDLIGSGVAFGTQSSFGVIDLDSGKRRWAKSLKPDQLGTRVAFDGATMVVSIGNGPIQAFDGLTGKPLWSLPHKGYSSPMLLLKGILFAETSPGQLTAISAVSHKTKWTMPVDVAATEAQVGTKPITINGNLVIGLRSGAATCIEMESGKPMWLTPLGDTSGGGSPVQGIVADNERIYATTARGDLYGIGLGSGTVVWHHDATNAIAGTPLLQDGRLIAVSSGGFVSYISPLNGYEINQSSFARDEDFSVTQAIPEKSGILFMRRSGGVRMDENGHLLDGMKFTEPASLRAPVPYKGDYILFGSHAVFRARVQ